MGLPSREALTVGVGMCGRAELAFILASLALAQQAIDQPIFTALIFTAFLLNLFTPLALKGCAVMLQGSATPLADATSGIIEVEPFGAPLVEERYARQLLHALPDVTGAVVIYGYGPEVDSLMGELDSRSVRNPRRRAPMQLAGATAAFTPNHVLARAIAARASSRIGPRITGIQPLARLLEVAEVRIHEQSPLANKRVAESGIRATTGAQIVVQWIVDKTEQPRVKLVKVPVGRLTGQHPFKSQMRERTGCSVIAVEQAGEVIMDIPTSFVLSEDDSLYICGTLDAFDRFYAEFAQ